MDNPSKYMSDGSYKKSLEGKAHSGIISSVNGTNVTVVSKWGGYGLYRHPEMHCPYPTVVKNTFWKYKIDF